MSFRENVSVSSVALGSKEAQIVSTENFAANSCHQAKSLKRQLLNRAFL
jgi:hypothetical protein